MDKIEVLAPAKVNFSIDVLGKRTDGYHEVEMIMQTLELHDVITIEKIISGIQIECDVQGIPTDSSNIGYKAAELFLNKYRLKEGIKIIIKKNIPVCAGLAGGSADAAAVLNGLNELFNIKASKDELCEIGERIGADVPFCIHGGTILVSGYGEKLEHLIFSGGFSVVIVKPNEGISTRWVYENLDLLNMGERPNNRQLIYLLSNGQTKEFAKNMVNVLESVAIRKVPDIEIIKNKLINYGALGAMMSGSGSAVFGLYDEYDKAKKAFSEFEKDNSNCFLTKTLNI